jgi:hypothetical protein
MRTDAAVAAAPPKRLREALAWRRASLGGGGRVQIDFTCAICSPAIPAGRWRPGSMSSARSWWIALVRQTILRSRPRSGLRRTIWTGCRTRRCSKLSAPTASSPARRQRTSKRACRFWTRRSETPSAVFLNSRPARGWRTRLRGASAGHAISLTTIKSSWRCCACAGRARWRAYPAARTMPRTRCAQRSSGSRPSSMSQPSARGYWASAAASRKQIRRCAAAART